MPISSFDSTGSVRRLEVADADLLGRGDEALDRPGDAAREQERQDERDDQGGETDENLRVLDLAERRELPLAASQRDGGADELVGGGAERQKVREVRSRRRPRARAARSSCPARSTAWTTSSRFAIAASAAAPSGPIVDAASAAFGPVRRTCPRRRGRPPPCCSSRSRLRATSSLIWKPGGDGAHQAGAALEHRRRDDVVELVRRRARSPRSARPAARRTIVGTPERSAE